MPVSAEREIEIVGQGLAGCCLSWHLHWKGVGFRTIDGDYPGAASRVAAGLVNPVTGKNFEPSWRISEFLPEAIDFFERVGEELGMTLWQELPVVRLVSEKEWRKVEAKLEREEVKPWLAGVEENVGEWRAAVRLKGGGRVNVKAFCEGTRLRQGSGGQAREEGKGEGQAREEGEGGGRAREEGKGEGHAREEGKGEGQAREEGKGGGQAREGGEDGGQETRVRCEGAAGLRQGQLGEHRCAKGEILTVRIAGGDSSRILIGAGGWLVPVGGGLFKAGSTYEWDQLDGGPSLGGRMKVEGILERLGVGEFEVVAHEAGVRPIVRRSMPLIGRVPDGSVVFNGLGSKGSLYAPGVARRLAEFLIDGSEIEEDLDVAKWMGA